MKEELINSFLEKMLQYANSAEIFARKNVPLYIEEILKFQMIDGILTIVGISFLLLLVFYITFYVIKNKKMETIRNIYTNEESEVLSELSKGLIITSSFLSLICTAVFLLTVPNTLSDIIKIKVAPRVYIIDYLKTQK